MAGMAGTGSRLVLLFGMLTRVAAWLQLTPDCPTCPAPDFRDSMRPCTRRGNSASRWGDNTLLLFGGRTVDYRNTTEQLVPPDISAHSPARVCDGTHCNLEGSAEECLLNGGCECLDGFTGPACEIEEVETFLNDLWLFDIVTNTWSYRNDSKAHLAGTSLTRINWPKQRNYHVTNVIDDFLILHGGYSFFCRDYCNDTWEFDLTTSEWYDLEWMGAIRDNNDTNSSSRPAKRWQHTTVTYENEMYIWGGHNNDQFFTDLWKYVRAPGVPTVDSRAWVQIDVDAPAELPRIGAAVAMHEDNMYVFGGFLGCRGVCPAVNSTNLDRSDYFREDMWVLNFGTMTWKAVTTMGPERPIYNMHHSAVVAKELLVFFGGYFNNDYNYKLWRFNTTNRAWTEHIFARSLIQRPYNRANAGMVSFPAHDKILMFGGHGSESFNKTTLPEVYLNDLWQFDLNACPASCSGRGTCYFGYCTCNNGYFGEDCQQKYCQGDGLEDDCVYDEYNRRVSCRQCSDKGKCVFGVCRCERGFSGRMCQIEGEASAAAEEAQPCLPNGTNC